MSDPRYDPDERFSLDDDPEDVLRKLLGTEGDEDTAGEPGEDEPT
jgi:hypothetical protein